MLKQVVRVGHHFSKEQDAEGKWHNVVNFALAFDEGSFVEFAAGSETLLMLSQSISNAQIEMNGLADKEKERIRGAVIRGLVKNNMAYADEQVADIVDRIFIN